MFEGFNINVVNDEKHKIVVVNISTLQKLIPEIAILNKVRFQTLANLLIKTIDIIKNNNNWEFIQYLPNKKSSLFIIRQKNVNQKLSNWADDLISASLKNTKIVTDFKQTNNAKVTSKIKISKNNTNFEKIPDKLNVPTNVTNLE